MLQEKTQQASGTSRTNQQPYHAVKKSMTMTAAWQEFCFKKKYRARKVWDKITSKVFSRAESLLIWVLLERPTSIRQWLKHNIVEPVLNTVIHLFIYFGANLFYGIYVIVSIPDHVRRLQTIKKSQKNETETTGN